MLRYLPLVLIPAVATADTKPAKVAPAPAPFAAQLDGQLAKQPGNLLYSPSSISIALAMLREGALGKTAEEMDRVLGTGNGAAAKAVMKSFKTAKQEPGQPMPPELAVANRIFADGATPFEQKFLDAVSPKITDPVARAKAAESLRKAHYARLALKSAQARRKAKTRTGQAELSGGDAALTTLPPDPLSSVCDVCERDRPLPGPNGLRSRRR